MKYLKSISVIPGLTLAGLIFPFGYVAGWIWIGFVVGYRQALSHLEMKLP